MFRASQAAVRNWLIQRPWLIHRTGAISGRGAMRGLRMVDRVVKLPGTAVELCNEAKRKTK